jgi:hypothetical protein
MSAGAAAPELLLAATATSLADLLAQRGDRGLVAFSEAATVGHALQRLLAEGLRTAPVVAADAADDAAGAGDWAGPFPLQAMRGYVEAPAVIELLMTGARGARSDAWGLAGWRDRAFAGAVLRARGQGQGARSPRCCLEGHPPTESRCGWVARI